MSLPKQAECSDCLTYGPVKWYVAAPSMVALCRRCQKRLGAWVKAHGLQAVKALR